MWVWRTRPESNRIRRCLPLVSTAVTVAPSRRRKGSGVTSSSRLPTRRGRRAFAVRQMVSPSGKQDHATRARFEAGLPKSRQQSRFVDGRAVDLQELDPAGRSRRGAQGGQVTHVDAAEGEQRAGAALEEERPFG